MVFVNRDGVCESIIQHANQGSTTRRGSRHRHSAGDARQHHRKISRTTSAARFRRWMDGRGSVFCFVGFFDYRDSAGRQSLATLLPEFLYPPCFENLAALLCGAAVHVLASAAIAPFGGPRGV